MKKIYIIAGEASGDIYGAELIKSLRSLSDEPIEFQGIGGEKMKEQGINSLFPMSEISIMGFWEILPHIPNTIRRIDQTVAEIKRIKPDMVITIDSPGFCCRVAKKLKGCDIKLVHYVAPTVWAYKPKRALKFAKLFDHLLVILPFEPPYFEEVGLPCTYIGHPITETKISADGALFRKKYNISESDKLLCLMPGSRITEINRLLDIFIDTVKILQKDITNLHIVIPVVQPLKEEISHKMQQAGLNAIIVSSSEEKYAAYAASDAALVKSGTGTLEVAMAGCPMVVTYKISTLSYIIIKSLIKIKFANLINIIMNREVIPEMLQQKCNPPVLANKINELLRDKSARNLQISDSNTALQLLGMGASSSPSENAARVIISLLTNK